MNSNIKELLLGNAAVARGLYEAGISVVSAYPGTPSTEITEAIAKELTAQKGGTLTIKKGVIVTQSAKDIFSREKMELVWETGR